VETFLSDVDVVDDADNIKFTYEVEEYGKLPFLHRGAKIAPFSFCNNFVKPH